MKRTITVTVLSAALLAAAAPHAMTAPEPFEVAIKWELEFEYEAPLPIQVTLPGEKKPRVFWYMLYTVTNRTRDDETGRGTDRDFIPGFVVYTETGQATNANWRVSSTVFQAVKKRHNRPLLKNHANITGKILFGKDNAKDGAIIWADFDPDAGSFDVFISGLSGETAELKLPAPITVTEIDAFGKAKTVKTDKIVLSKTLQLNYTVKGQAEDRIFTTATFNYKRWVMR